MRSKHVNNGDDEEAHGDADSRSDEFLRRATTSATKKVRRVSIPSLCPSFAEYVQSCVGLEGSAYASVNSALWNAANSYLWLRVSEEQLREHLTRDMAIAGQPLLVEPAFIAALLREFRQRRLEYFSRQWQNLDSVAAVCASDHRRWNESHMQQDAAAAAALLASSSSSSLGTSSVYFPLVTSNQWRDDIIGHSLDRPWLVLAIVAPFCALCREVMPELKKIAEASQSRGVLFAHLDASREEEFCSMIGVTRCPCLDLWKNGVRVDRLYLHSPKEVDNVGVWLTQHVGGPDTFASPTSWRSIFSADQLSALRSSLHELRRQSSVKEALRALGCLETPIATNGGGDGGACCTIQTKPQQRADAPTVILMGGGIASGKTTVAAALRDTEFWALHGPNTVIVEADRFKASDPLMEHLVQRGAPHSFAAQTVHRESTSAAEELFLDALSAARDIIFDGTLKWSPFVTQTIAMIRDCHLHRYKRGPGFKGHGKEEIYWIRDAPWEVPKRPYLIWLVAAHCNPLVSVGRSVRRAVLDGRGVAIQEVLLSNKWFSTHFPSYERLVDMVTLYDNSKSRPLVGNESLPIIAEKSLHQPFRIIDAQAFEQFCKCATINAKAGSAMELYVSDEERRQQGANGELVVEDLEQHAAPLNPIVSATFSALPIDPRSGSSTSKL